MPSSFFQHGAVCCQLLPRLSSTPVSSTMVMGVAKTHRRVIVAVNKDERQGHREHEDQLDPGHAVQEMEVLHLEHEQRDPESGETCRQHQEVDYQDTDGPQHVEQELGAPESRGNQCMATSQRRALPSLRLGRPAERQGGYRHLEQDEVRQTAHRRLDCEDSRTRAGLLRIPPTSRVPVRRRAPPGSDETSHRRSSGASSETPPRTSRPRSAARRRGGTAVRSAP